jgi:hypothetical protein
MTFTSVTSMSFGESQCSLRQRISIGYADCKNDSSSNVLEPTDCMFICNMLMIEVMFWIGTLKTLVSSVELTCCFGYGVSSLKKSAH